MEGAKLRVNGEGEAGFRNSSPGDLYLLIHMEPHDIFERHEDDLYIEKEISFSQAVLGDKIKVPTLKGEAVLKIPSGTEPGSVFKLKGKGIPHLHNYGRGDQMVKIFIDIPKKLNRKQEKLLKEFDKSLK